ncbi:MAG: 2-oxoacid:acceptor oxidoreductase family protein [Planctomycetes bacterium]|nr:2-oxoacid:acceptor oxidoreductase family protein [Planctomycetota bacterium]
MNKRIEIWFGGIGGQGVVYAANLLGQMAGSEYKYVSAAAHYGPESRGSVTTSEVVLSDKPMDYPYVESPNIFIAMHQKAYEEITHHKATKTTKGINIIYDSTLVGKAADGIAIPATKLAQEYFKNAQMANLILLGAFLKTYTLIDRQALRKVMTESQLSKTAREAIELGLAQ